MPGAGNLKVNPVLPLELYLDVVETATGEHNPVELQALGVIELGALAGTGGDDLETTHAELLTVHCSSW